MVRVLVVDDEDMIRGLLADCLEDGGFSVQQASSGGEALRLLGAEPFAVAIIDLRLPDMDGETLLGLAAGRAAGTRFLIHTGTPDPVLTETMARMGIGPEHVFVKPAAGLDRIVEAVRALTRRTDTTLEG